MLVDYDGAEEFGAEVVTRLSREFTELRPDCLAQGWNPEFPVEPEVCHERGDLPRGMSYRFSQRTLTQYLSPTSREFGASYDPDLEREVEFVLINVHLDRVPLLSDVPEKMQPVSGMVGGCWTYRGVVGVGGYWDRSYFRYSRSGTYLNRHRPWVIGNKAPVGFPECDSLLQAALGKVLESGASPDVLGVADLVDRVRVLADGVCDSEIFRYKGWNSVPVEGPAKGCPVSAPTGVQADGSYVLHWAESHYDGYGRSVCWELSPDGEWGAYLQR